MSYWKESAEENIIPLSVSQDLKAALSEWNYTGEVTDLEDSYESCQLCNHPNIRYKFEIFNFNTGKYLYVGSECIKKFELHAINESGELLSLEETLKLVNQDRRSIIKNSRDKRVVNSLLILSELSTHISFIDFIKYYNENGAFTPNQLSLIVWQLEEYDVKYNKSDFKMKIRRNREKDQLLRMKQWQVKKIWDCMSTYQKKFYNRNK